MTWSPIGEARLNLQQRRHDNAAHQARQLAVIARESEPDLVFARPTHATAAGDERKLRGIPAIGKSVTGAIPGTIPHVHGIGDQT